MRRAVFTTACIVALLFAQFSALTHAAWHMHGGLRAAASSHGHDHDHECPAHGEEHPASQAELCAFDLAFGQVLGGIHGGGALPLALTQGTAFIPDVPVARLRAEVLAAKSRGPPVFL